MEDQKKELTPEGSKALNQEVAGILKPLFVKPPAESLLYQFAMPGAKLSFDKIKDKLMDEVIGAVCSDEIDIPSYLISRLVLSRSDAQELAAVGSDYLSVLSAISGKEILKRSDLPTFFRWLVAKHPAMVRKASQFSSIFRG